MKKQSRKIIETTVFAIILLFALNSCETWRNDCGDIIIENPIQDKTLNIGETYYRDLFADPVVLRHSKNENIGLTVTEEKDNILEANVARSRITGRLNAIQIQTFKVGSTTVSIIADDGCNELYMDFKITVVDVTNN